MLIILLAVLALMIWKRVKFNKQGKYIVSIISIIIIGVVCKWFNAVYIEPIEPKGYDSPTHYYSYYRNGEHAGNSPLYTRDGQIYQSISEIKESNKKVWRMLTPMIFLVFYLVAGFSAEYIINQKKMSIGSKTDH
jgi:hypothetical protein